jgi:hypothetical protein
VRYLTATATLAGMITDEATMGLSIGQDERDCELE